MQRLKIVLSALFFALLGIVVAFLYPSGGESFWIYELLGAVGVVSASLTLAFNEELRDSLREHLREWSGEWRRNRVALLVVGVMVGAVLASWVVGVLAAG
ncbi:hypothetical protein [Rubrobacter aplysinae]|uniref:hypothetical protein n=1 Tax=Rubrobacter aplysinae TaxID=909625 RepID=UPI00064BD549|nr:hypothetical protein [Rubrobacter aplysinae]